jgi:DNA-binding beta-propeller fold protein YncE
MATLKTPGAPYALTVDSLANKVYAVGLNGSALTVIDGATLQVSQLAPESKQ